MLLNRKAPNHHTTPAAASSDSTGCPVQPLICNADCSLANPCCAAWLRNGSTFPVKVRHGSVTVPVYRTPTKGRDLYTVSYYLHGKRQRRTFADFAEAKQEAENAAFKIANGEVNALTLRDEDKFVYLRAT